MASVPDGEEMGPAGALLCQPLCHSLVVHRVGFPLALLWFFSLQTGEGVLGTVTVGVCEPISTSCGKTKTAEVSEVEQSRPPF